MRQILNFNANWLFSKAAQSVPASLPADWESVQLPHSWNAVDGQDGGNDYYRGTAYYARKIVKSELPAAERYYLEVQGANSSADVYLDGEKKAHHDGGYSTWRVDLTDALKDESLLVIAVDNAPNETVYPQMADFTFYGGIYRDVNIICVNESHFDLDHFGGPGLAVTPEIEGKDAKVTVEAWISNKKSGQTVRYTLHKQCGCEVACVETEETKAVMEIKNVHLWHGRKDPYLYTAKVELLENGEVIDCVSARFGCRTFKIDPENGFILNGEEYPLRGVSRHQDRWGIGNALLPEHHKEDIDLICEVGATTIRLAHYQHDQYFYDLCDEKGLVIWAEIPYITTHLDDGVENTRTQMTELVVQNYNHPCIVVWGLSNEINAGTPADAGIVPNHHMLNDLCHAMDKTRLTTMAAVSTAPTHHEYISIPDTVSYNHYFGWYGGELDHYGPWFDKFHAEHPNQPIGCSEYGCEALNWHNSNPDAGDYSEEYQAVYHESLIRQLFTRKYLWATHVWNMFDFGADGRNEGGEDGQNHKGLVTFDRKYKKDSFYAYKAWLNPDPMVHICGKRYIDRVEDVTKVTVYSNQPSVELFANGVSLGVQEAEDHFFYFQVPNVGTTHLVAKAGELTDESVINKVSEPNPAYILVEKGAVLNWWDIVSVPGHADLNTKLRFLNAALGLEGTARLLAPMLGEQFAAHPQALGQLDSFSVLRMLNLVAGAMMMPMTKEQLLDLNAQLNKIPVDC